MVRDEALLEVRSFILTLLGSPHQQSAPSLDRVIRQRMDQMGILSPKEYLKLLREQRDEQDRCIASATIKETYFFREPAYLSLFIDQIIPRLLKDQPSVTILSAGCSIGAEAYSIAIAVHEQFGPQVLERCRIIGIDVDRDAVRKARSGVYTPYVLRALSKTRRSRYFINRDERFYEVIPEIRRAVSFQQMNLLDQQKMGELEPVDILLYRNVSIYLDMDSRIQVFSSLADRLSWRGVLITGASETLAHDIGVLSLVSQGDLFYFTHHAGEGPSTPAELPREPVQLEPAAAEVVEEQTLKGVLERALEGDYDEAWRKIQRMQVPPEHESSRDILQAGILYNLKRFDEALQICDRLIGRDPLCMEGYLIRAMVHRLQNDIDTALGELKKVLYLNRECWVASYYSGELYHQLGEKRMAKVFLRRVMLMMEQGNRRDRLLVFPVNRISTKQVIRLCRYALDKL